MLQLNSMETNLPDSARAKYITDTQIRRTVMHNRDYDIAAVAQILVSERHRKSDLIHLVEHLLVELANSKQKLSLYESMSPEERQTPVARAYIREQDDGLEARIEVLNATHMQASHSPVDLYLLPPATTPG